jgi:Sulfotransferase family
MAAYDSSSPLISIHIAKTAGTSLTSVLRSWFGDRMRLHYSDPWTRPGCVSPPTRHKWEGSICIHGHFVAERGFGVQEYYPQATQFIVFLREPFDRFQSLWRHLHEAKRRGAHIPELDGDPDFGTFLLRWAEVAATKSEPNGFNWQLPPQPVSGSSFFDDRFLFVGLVERYAESLAALAATLGMDSVATIPYENRTEPVELDFAQWRPLHEKHFSREYVLYEEARRLNATMIDQAIDTTPLSVEHLDRVGRPFKASSVMASGDSSRTGSHGH